MSIRQTAARVGLVAAGLAVVAGGAGVAHADMDRYTPGSHSWRTGSGAGAPNAMAAVMDTRADGNPVYTRYNRNYPSTELYSLWNKSGEGTTSYSGTGGVIWDMKTCVSNPAAEDLCSVWWSDDH
ncbi:hypothetical protein ACFWA9_00655 [Kitasatospora sp. NPDC059973]|uniref:hypothetical protein n=1 Tax=Kitasatospora sp. NPDC059973 TaxID=3347020 RepID=UPI0036AC0D3D